MKMKLNRFQVNGVTILQLCYSLYLAFCRWGEVTKKTGTTAACCLSVSFYVFSMYFLYFRDQQYQLANSISISEILMMNWRKWKQSWFATSISYIFMFYQINLSLICAYIYFQDANSKNNHDLSKNKLKVST